MLLQVYKTNKVLPMKMHSFTWWPDTYRKQTKFSQWKCIPLLDGLTTIQNKQSSPNENVFLYLMARHLYKTNNVLPMKMYSFTWWADNYTKQTEFSQSKCIPLLDGQTTPASSLCPQLCTPHTLLGQVAMLASVPRQWTSSSQILPLPWPKWAFVIALAPVLEKRTRFYLSMVHIKQCNSVIALGDTLKSNIIFIRKEGNVLFNDALKTFYLRLYGIKHMVKDHSDSLKGNPLPLHVLLFLTARVLLYVSSHRQDSTYHGLCYTSRGALAGTRNRSMGPPHVGHKRKSYKFVLDNDHDQMLISRLAQIAREETHWRYMCFSFWSAARVVKKVREGLSYLE